MINDDLSSNGESVMDPVTEEPLDELLSLLQAPEASTIVLAVDRLVKRFPSVRNAHAAGMV
jgi:hypothetical protein